MGIGKNNPSTALDVNGTVKASGFSGSGAGLAGLNAGNLSSGTVADGRLSANVALRNAGNTFTGNQIVSSGNVGIGTRVPQALLDVNGTARVDALEGPPGQPLELRVGGQRGLRLEPTTEDVDNSGIVNVVGGSPANDVAPGVYGATIAGGGAFDYWLSGPYGNSVSSDFGSIGGGLWNETRAEFATIGGGNSNEVGADGGTISGGTRNWIKANSTEGTISGGCSNGIEDNAWVATIGGGFDHRIEANALFATIPGGATAVARSYGQQAYASGNFDSIIGTAQASLYVLRAVTTDTSQTELFLNFTGTERMKIPAGSTWVFEILLVARTQDAGEFIASQSAGFRFSGGIQNAGGLTTMRVYNSEQLWNDGLGNAWPAADTVNDALVIRVQGTSTPIRWVATVRTSEVMFPASGAMALAGPGAGHIAEGPLTSTGTARTALNDRVRSRAPTTSPDGGTAGAAAVQGLNRKADIGNAPWLAEFKARDDRIAELEQRLERLERLLSQNQGGGR